MTKTLTKIKIKIKEIKNKD